MGKRKDTISLKFTLKKFLRELLTLKFLSSQLKTIKIFSLRDFLRLQVDARDHRAVCFRTLIVCLPTSLLTYLTSHIDLYATTVKDTIFLVMISQARICINQHHLTRHVIPPENVISPSYVLSIWKFSSKIMFNFPHFAPLSDKCIKNMNLHADWLLSCRSTHYLLWSRYLKHKLALR